MSTLEGASKYLNNLLLARGLLRDGKAIDFARREPECEVSDVTATQVINLVHELVLRRDREAEQHETVIATIRTMRSEESQRLLDFQRLQDKNILLKNNMTTLEAQVRSSNHALKRAEIQAKDLKEQNMKLKSMFDQVRAKCLSDVRKRDLEIEKLKGHISGSQRGKKESSGMKITTISTQSIMANSRERRAGQDVSTAGLSLERESNEFLAALVNEASTENVALREIVTETVSSLKELTGFDAGHASKNEVENDEAAIGIPGQFRPSRHRSQQNSLASCDALAGELSSVIDHCRSILKDPSFVPIEEVQARDDEIAKLKIGWDKMADRWKQAVTMMAQWKQRMVEDGNAIDVGTEFSDLSFGRSIALRADGQPVLDREHELSLIYEQSGIELDDSVGSEIEQQQSEVEVDSHESAAFDEESDLELEPPHKRLAASPARRGVRLPRPSRVLGETNGNTSKRARTGQTSRPPVIGLDDSTDVENNTFEHKAVSRLPIPSKTSVAEKLAMVQAEAAAAEAQRQENKTHKRKASGQKSRSKRASRRRSTLSPEELAALMTNS